MKNRDDVSINGYMDLVGSVFRMAFKDYHNRANERYGHIPHNQKTESQKTAIRNQDSARHFIDKMKGEPYASAFGINTEAIHREYKKINKIK